MFLPEIEHARELVQMQEKGREGQCEGNVHLCESILRTAASFWRSDSDAPGAELDFFIRTFLTAHMVPCIPGMPEMHIILGRRGGGAGLQKHFTGFNSKYVAMSSTASLTYECL